MWLFKNVSIGDLNNCALRDILSHLRFCTRIYLFLFQLFSCKKIFFILFSKISQAVIFWKLNPDWRIAMVVLISYFISSFFVFCLSYPGLVRFLGCPLNYNISKWSHLFKSTQRKIFKYIFFETLKKKEAKNNLRWLCEKVVWRCCSFSKIR